MMDANSEKLSEDLRLGHVPEAWSGKKLSKTVEQYLQIIKLRAEFYQVRFRDLDYKFFLFTSERLHSNFVKNFCTWAMPLQQT